MTDTTILHLTDLHFGWDAEQSKLAERKIVLDSLIDKVASLERDWKPSAICVSGDIGWRGHATDYADAEAWLKTLLDRIGLTFSDVLVCAGNHDTDRRLASTFSRPRDNEEADQVLRVPVARHYLECFSEFTAFCKRVGIRPFSFDNQESYILGHTDLHGIRFVALNSAWYCKGDDDKNRLWVGLPHVRQMEADGHLQKVNNSLSMPVVGLIHHPDDWWHEEETRACSGRPNTRDYFAVRCSLILNGHTHGEVRRADRIAQSALHLTGGAAYAGASHFNSFRLVRINSDNLTYRSFEYDPRSSENQWRDHGASEKLPFVERPPDAPRVAMLLPAVDINPLRAASKLDALRTVEVKSRLVKTSGKLPESSQLLVEVRVSAQLDKYDSSGRLQMKEGQVVALSLYEACRRSRRSVLFGDLGSGKSTLASLFVLETMERDPDALAFLIPAKALRIDEEFRLDELLQACGKYLSSQVVVRRGPCDLRVLLERDVELTLAIDGLDEVQRPKAAQLLRQLSAITDNWSNAQVLATGRPIELAGVSYATWGLCHVGRLGNAEKEAVFRAEAAAEGNGTVEAAEIAKRRLSLLKRHPGLDEMACTVLAARLLYPRLVGAFDSDAQSIGDLLYDLLIDRLGAWAEKELKRSPYEHFESQLQTAEQRAELLGALALAKPERAPWTREAAEQALLPPSGDDRIVARQALEFFEQVGLLALADGVEFSFQPLVEMASATALISKWASGECPDAKRLAARWRTVAFAAVVARRRALTSQVRPRILEVVVALLQSVEGVPPACMIVSESRDTGTAVATIEELRKLGRKPLRWYDEERFTSNHAIALTIRLAGVAGFNWFLSEYLDARSPIVHRGSAVVDEVFAHWAWLSRGTITEAERRQLRPLVRPLLQGDGLFALLPSLAFTAPDAFSEPERLWYVTAFLNHTLFGEEAVNVLTQAVGGTQRSFLRTILQLHAERSRRAAPLFLRLFPEDDVPSSIARGVLRWWAISPDDQSIGEALEACEERLGEAAWRRFLHWSLTDNERAVAAGAALLLHRRGERRVQILGDVLLNALHDGGYIRRAEEVLGELLEQDRNRSLHWLAHRMAASRGLDGGHSGWWRLLLKLLDQETPNSPEILRECMAGIGPFLLPRYPEVRDGLSRLLAGTPGERFHKELRAQLWYGDPRARHGAAAVLLTCDPGAEGEALYATAATRGEIGSYHHEWEAFCLSLAFGPTVLESLHARLDQLNQAGRAFALAILFRHGYALSASEREEFYGYLQDLGNWSLAPTLTEEVKAEREEWFAFLRGTLARPIDERGRRAAERLLTGFHQRLTPEEMAKCRVWASLGRIHEGDLLREEIARLLEDKEYRTGLRAIFEDVTRFLGHPCVLERIAQAATDPGAWQEVVWGLVADGSSMEVEEGGQLVLELGRDHPEHASAIGVASGALLSDIRLADQFRVEARQWLTLLTHEFGSLPPDMVRGALLAGSPIGWGAARALIARLGEVPSGMPRRQYPGDFPEQLRTLAQSETEEIITAPLEALRTYGREGGPPPLVACDALERLLCSPSVVEEDLNGIARQGNPGIFIAETIRFCAGLPPCLADHLPLLFELKRLEHLREHKCFNRLRENVLLAHELALEDRQTRETYIRLLGQRLERRTDLIAPFVTELLRYGGTLLPEQLKPIIEEFALVENIYQSDLGIALLRWVVALHDGPMVEPMASASEHGVRILWERGPIARGEAHSPYPFLLLPLIVWALRQSCDDASIGLYWRGMRRLFSSARHEQGKANAMGLLEEVAPLVARIPQTVWVAVREAGTTFEDPIVRSLLALLNGFTGERPKVCIDN